MPPNCLNKCIICLSKDEYNGSARGPHMHCISMHCMMHSSLTQAQPSLRHTRLSVFHEVHPWVNKKEQDERLHCLEKSRYVFTTNEPTIIDINTCRCSLHTTTFTAVRMMREISDRYDILPARILIASATKPKYQVAEAPSNFFNSFSCGSIGTLNALKLIFVGLCLMFRIGGKKFVSYRHDSESTAVNRLQRILEKRSDYSGFVVFT